jgi:hypothetical protein
MKGGGGGMFGEVEGGGNVTYAAGGRWGSCCSSCVSRVDGLAKMKEGDWDRGGAVR